MGKIRCTRMTTASESGNTLQKNQDTALSFLQPSITPRIWNNTLIISIPCQNILPQTMDCGTGLMYIHSRTLPEHSARSKRQSRFQRGHQNWRPKNQSYALLLCYRTLYLIKTIDYPPSTNLVTKNVEKIDVYSCS